MLKYMDIILHVTFKHNMQFHYFCMHDINLVMQLNICSILFGCLLWKDWNVAIVPGKSLIKCCLKCYQSMELNYYHLLM